MGVRRTRVMRLVFVRALAIYLDFTVLVVAALSGCASSPRPTPRPNILILFSDDQRGDTIAALEMHDHANDSKHAGEQNRLTSLFRDWQKQLGDTQPLSSSSPRPKDFDFSAVEP
jgi:hypothetical protein